MAAFADVRFESDGLGTLTVEVAGADLGASPVSVVVTWHRHQACAKEERSYLLTSSCPLLAVQFSEVLTQDCFEVKLTPPIPFRVTTVGPRGTREIKSAAIVFFLEHLDPVSGR
jgi:hypothetical protein